MILLVKPLFVNKEQKCNKGLGTAPAASITNLDSPLLFPLLVHVRFDLFPFVIYYQNIGIREYTSTWEYGIWKYDNRGHRT